MRPRAVMTAQNLPNVPSGAKPSTSKEPWPLERAAAYEGVVETPLARPMPRRRVNVKDNERERTVRKKRVGRGVVGG